MGMYIGGQKISPIIKVGEINNQDKTITENGTYTADNGYTGLGEVTVNVSPVQPVITELNVTPTTSAQTINPPSGVHGHAPVNVAAVTSSIDSNIIAGNIKKDVQILGVTGTYEGSATLVTKNITQNGTYNASSDNADGYSTVTVNVSGGGGGVGITREVSATGGYQMPAANFTFSLPSNATDVKTNAMRYAFSNCSSLTSVDLSSLTTITGSSAMSDAFLSCFNLASIDVSNLTTISGNSAMSNTFMSCGVRSVDLSNLTTITGNSAMNNTFSGCGELRSVDLSSLTTITGDSAMKYAFSNCSNLISVDLSSLTTISGSQAMGNTFQSCSNLTSVDFPNLEQIGINNNGIYNGHFANCFYGCTSLTTLNFPKLEKIYCTGNSTSNGTFYNCNKITKIYFPKLDTITYGTGASSSYQNACKNIFYKCASLIELHFAAANQSAIEASPGYSTAWGRGAGNVTIYFDL